MVNNFISSLQTNEKVNIAVLCQSVFTSFISVSFLQPILELSSDKDERNIFVKNVSFIFIIPSLLDNK